VGHKSSRVCLILILFVYSLAVQAQVDRASVTGTAFDPTGAVIPGVAIEARNLDTGFVQRTSSAGAGSFTLVGLIANENWDENTGMFRVDHRFSDKFTGYVRYNVADGDLESSGETAKKCCFASVHRTMNCATSIRSRPPAALLLRQAGPPVRRSVAGSST
jgi:hypothetical protein